jgi:hypothetical protein
MLVAYDVALDLVRALRPVITQLRKYSSEAADQVERAASSDSGTSHTVAPGRSAARSIWQMRGAGRSTARSDGAPAARPNRRGHPFRVRSDQRQVARALVKILPGRLRA